ncbi:MAG: DNA polymerase III subunit gamma/tau [Syntrophales bacterium]|nr:DNA polymerase III subunit gamma/tau [Syntrophales bacterium]
MSEYLVIARKWRPQTLDEVVGQHHVVTTLRNAITHGRIAHAFLFSGPRGVGKTSVARILAKALNCVHGPTPSPCDGCANCREIRDGISLDVREIDGASNRGIDEIRELRENIKFLPASCRYKVYIIDEVHMLTREAFNALLKSLEEPPSHVVFIFATTEVHKIPATILSRCQHFEFFRLSVRDIVENLKKIALKEGVQISERALTWIAASSEGSLRDAQSVFDQIISYTGREIRDDQVEELLGRKDRHFVYELGKSIIRGDAPQCLRVIEQAYSAGMDMVVMHEMLTQHFRSLLLVKVMGTEAYSVLSVTEDDFDDLKKQVNQVPRERLEYLLDVLLSSSDSMRRSLQYRLSLEAVVLKMVRLMNLPTLEEILERLESLERRIIVSGDERSKKGETLFAFQDESREAYVARPGDSTRWNCDSRSSLWDSFKEFVIKNNPPLGARLEGGSLVSLENGVLKIGFPRKHVFLDDLLKKARGELRDLAVRFFGGDVSGLVVEVQGDETVYNGQRESDGKDALSEARSQALNSRALQEILDFFPDAEVKEVKVYDSKRGGK